MSRPAYLRIGRTPSVCECCCNKRISQFYNFYYWTSPTRSSNLKKGRAYLWWTDDGHAYLYIYLSAFLYTIPYTQTQDKYSSWVGIEPATFDFEVISTNHCTDDPVDVTEKLIIFKGYPDRCNRQVAGWTTTSGARWRCLRTARPRRVLVRGPLRLAGPPGRPAAPRGAPRTATPRATTRW